MVEFKRVVRSALGESSYNKIKKVVKDVVWQAFPPLKPSAICIGAQKAGTTALYEYLSLHPDVAPSRVKEIDFFNSDIHYSKGIDFYHSYFPLSTPSNSRKLTFDITPGYMDRAELTAKRIRDYNPDIRLISLLRNPATRAYSAWQMYQKYCAKNRDWFWQWVQARSSEAPENTYVRRSSLFGNNFLDDVREEMDAIQSGRRIEMPILPQGMYSVRLEPYFKYFSRDQILVISSEEFNRNTGKMLQIVESFVGLNPNTWTQDALRPRHVGSYKEKISPEALSLLNAFYHDYNVVLSDLVDREFDWD